MVDPQGNRPSATEVVKDVAPLATALLTIFVATIYAVGTFAWWLSLGGYLNNYSLAWDMVSLIPRTVVVGKGALYLLWPTLPLMIGGVYVASMLWSLLYTFVYLPVRFLFVRVVGRSVHSLMAETSVENPSMLVNSQRKSPLLKRWLRHVIIFVFTEPVLRTLERSYISHKEESIRVKNVMRAEHPRTAQAWGFMVRFWVLLYLAFVAVLLTNVGRSILGFLTDKVISPIWSGLFGPIADSLDAYSITAMVLGGLIGIWFWYSSFGSDTAIRRQKRVVFLEQGGLLPPHAAASHTDSGFSARRAKLKAFAAIYLGAVAAAFLIAGQNPPTLQSVHIALTTSKEVDGELLTHFDSTWYVIEDADKAKALIAIPDREVKQVHTSP